MNKLTLNQNLFTLINNPEPLNLMAGNEFSLKLYFTYNGRDNEFKAKVYGNPKTTGLHNTGLANEKENIFSIHIFGKPRQTGKDYIEIKLSNKTEFCTFKIPYFVEGLKFLDFNLPDAVGLRKKYSATIHFYNPTLLKPKFMYNFPVEFGYVNTESDDSIDYTTIFFYPTKPGKYKFFVQALSEDNIVLGARTLHLQVFDPEANIPPQHFESAKAIDMKDWK